MYFWDLTKRTKRSLGSCFLWLPYILSGSRCCLERTYIKILLLRLGLGNHAERWVHLIRHRNDFSAGNCGRSIDAPNLFSDTHSFVYRRSLYRSCKSTSAPASKTSAIQSLYNRKSGQCFCVCFMYDRHRSNFACNTTPARRAAVR